MNKKFVKVFPVKEDTSQGEVCYTNQKITMFEKIQQ